MKLFTILLITFLSWQALGSDLKIVTFNVYRKPEIGANFYSKERMKKICGILKNNKHPENNGWDIVLIQEAWTVGSRKAFKNCGYKNVVDIGVGKWNVRDRVRHRLGGIRPRPGRHGKELNIESGLLILTNLPIHKSLRYIYNNEGRLFNAHRDGEIIAAKSLYLIQTELENGEKIWVGNTHLIANYCDGPVTPDCESYEDVRTKQLYEMKNVIDIIVGDDPIVFGGDLNAGEHINAKDRSWREFSTIFPGFSQAPHDELNIITSGPSNSFKKGHAIGGKLDHIFASSHFLIDQGKLTFDKVFKSQEGININYSDHYAWESRLRLK